jgi:hypothetical protein
MSRRVLLILICCVAAGVIAAVAISQLKNAGDVMEPEESDGPPETPEVMTVGDFISRLVTEEYRNSIEGKELTIKQGTTVRILGRVRDFRVSGQHPQFKGEIDLTPYYCFRKVQCTFEGEAVSQLGNLEKDKDVIIEGKYAGITCHEVSRDIYRLVDCLLLSIESSQNWTTPMNEEMRGDAISAEYLSNWSVQSELSKGDTVRVFGSIFSIIIQWSYLEGIWGDVLVSEKGIYGAQCRFAGEEVYEIMELPEEQEVIIEGVYDHGTANCAYLTNCSLIYPWAIPDLSKAYIDNG